MTSTWEIPNLGVCWYSNAAITASSQLDAGCTATTMAMAQPQGFPQRYAQQNKGTLVPGQTISVNKYTVQVERYLSQGMSIAALEISMI